MSSGSPSSSGFFGRFFASAWETELKALPPANQAVVPKSTNPPNDEA